MTKSNLKSAIARYALQSLKQISILFQHVAISFLVFRFFVGEDLLLLKGDSSSLGNMIDGTAMRPYVLRVLIPATIRFIRGLVPETAKLNIQAFFEKHNWFVAYLRSDRAVENALALVLSFIFFLGFSFVLRSLAKRFYCKEPFVQSLVVYGGMLIIPLCSSYGHHIYDPGTIFLFSFGVLLVVKERLLPMLIFFPILALHKETSVLLILVFIVYQFRRMRLPKIAVISSVMGAVWVVIRIFVIRAFAANPGSVVEFHLFDHNLKLFSNPIEACFFLVVVIVLGALISYDWKSKNQFLRQGFLVVFCPLYFLAIFFGFIDELRAFYEAAPFIALLIAPPIAKLARS